MIVEAHRKLLDMLVAWSAQCDKDGREIEAEDVADLYQKAGAIDHPATEEDISNFVTKEVLPYILRGK